MNNTMEFYLHNIVNNYNFRAVASKSKYNESPILITDILSNQAT